MPAGCCRGRLGRRQDPGPLRAFYERVRARRGMQIAVVTARKLCVLCWHMITRGEDYAFARPSLTAKKLRALELKAGHRPRRGQKGSASGYSLKDVRAREKQMAEQADAPIASSSPTARRPPANRWAWPPPTGRDFKALCGASCAAGISPRTCASLGGRPRPPAG